MQITIFKTLLRSVGSIQDVMLRYLCAFVTIVVSCSNQGSSNVPTTPNASVVHSKIKSDGSQGVTDPRLKKILSHHWSQTMKANPIWASMLGYSDYASEIGDNSLESIAAFQKLQDESLFSAKALTDLSPDDELTRELFVFGLQASIATRKCKRELWGLSARNNPVGNFNYLPKVHEIKVEGDAEALLSRYEKISGYVEVEINNLRQGASAGLVVDQETLQRTIELIDKELAKPTEKQVLMEPTAGFPTAWDEETKNAWNQRFLKTVTESILPSFHRYNSFLKNELLVKAKGKVGLAALPLGPSCYRAKILQYTDKPQTAASLHLLGLSEIKRIHEQMLTLGKKRFGVNALEKVFHSLKNDPSLYYESAEEIMADATNIVEEATSKLPAFFSELPKAPVIVVPIPDYEAPFTTIAYYRQPEKGGAKPGQYYVNTYKPKTRPKYQMRALSVHEAVPGHHLQIAIAQQQKALPAFRRFGGYTSFVEGWGLYSERLGEEMGLYETDDDKLGMLSFELWRAIRLVVDTGIHDKGWSRKQAEEFMKKNSSLTDINIRNEVDRYINTPGQALAYKVGQLELLRLRKKAESHLGKRFSLPQFHTQILKHGAVNLIVLERLVDEWIQAKTSAGSA